MSTTDLAGVPPAPPKTKGSGLGIAGFATSAAGLVVGMASFVFMFMLPLVIGVVGASLSLAALITGRGKWWAITGLILGGLAIALGIAGGVAMNDAINELDKAFGTLDS